MWVQTYAPVLGSTGVSALVAVLPIALTFVLLGIFRRPAHVATLAGFATAFVLATVIWGMPVRLAIAASLLGAAVALVPLLWTLVAAVWFINLLTHSGQFEIVKRSLAALTADRRLQTLLVGYGFIGLLEGLVAMGSPVAIGAAMLAGFGFPPIAASVAALIGFSHPGVWGPMGLPVTVLQSVTSGIDLDTLGAMIGRQVPWLTFVCAPVMVWAVAGWRGLRGVWPITLATGFAFAAVTFLTSNYLTLYVAGSAGALAAILTTVAGLGLWRPATLWRFPGDPAVDAAVGQRLRWTETVRAWAPIALLIAIIGLVSGTGMRDVLAAVATIDLMWFGLHDLVTSLPPVVAAPTPVAAVYRQPLLVLPGTIVLLTGLVSLPLLRITAAEAGRVYARTVRQLRVAICTTVSIIALGYVMNYAGLSLTIGLALAVSGPWFPAVAVLLGVIGNAVAGTNTASNALFGNLVAVAGEQASASPVFAASSLAAGGSMGKALAPQSLALAAGATGRAGSEGELLRRVAAIVLVLSLGFAAYAMAQHHLFPWTIPLGDLP
jgi:L-lactate transport